MTRSPGERRGLLFQLLISGAMKGGGGLLTFACFIFIARAASAEQYGLFSILFSIAMLACYVIVGGQHTAILKVYPRVSEEGPMSAAGGYVTGLALRRIGLIALAAFGAAIPVWFVLSALAGDIGLTIDLPLVLWTVALSILLGLAEFFSSFFRARGMLLAGMWPRDILWRGFMIVFFGAALFLYAPITFRADLFSASALIAWTAALLLIALGIQILRLAMDWRRIVRDEGLDRNGLNADMNASFWSFWGLGLIWPARGQLGTIVVGLMISPEVAGAFFSAQRLASVLLMVSVAINTAMGPQISRAFAANDFDKAKRVFGTASIVAGGTSAAFMIVLLFFGADLLALFDPAYSNFAPVLLVLALGQALFNACGPLGVLLTLADRERQVLWSAIVATAATLIGVIVFTGRYGAMGAAVVMAVVTVALNLYLAGIGREVFASAKKTHSKVDG
ncbi:lipopolysaccharide biosynthesis protein [Erythrobacter litoralis]|uniref:lipopolysaccharide biosynthesis protein n=1 Tax=Erythrobacter litoralis TaxID=39960 RepID=UPI002434CC88|nr:lipopolysaccharide biosynthesis protein [Erythrobacter litoralis]MDG6078257.1 lipopolysaccharide biosynthesis protein [Erythrobacter litoralis]